MYEEDGTFVLNLANIVKQRGCQNLTVGLSVREQALVDPTMMNLIEGRHRSHERGFGGRQFAVDQPTMLRRQGRPKRSKPLSKTTDAGEMFN